MNNRGSVRLPKKTAYCLPGMIAGDVIGSVYEYSEQKSMDFPLFSQFNRVTDDSVLTLAVADAILNRRSYLQSIQTYSRAYPDSDFGGGFRIWMASNDP